jgi:hypothetical protein
MKTNYLKTNENEIIKFSDLKNNIPSIIYESELHDNICLSIARRKIPDTESDKFKLYVNLLILKSSKAKELTALIFIITNKILNIKEINCNYIERSFFDDFVDTKYGIKYIASRKESNFIDAKYKYIIFPIKMLIHRLYRLLRSNIGCKNHVIKTYVEDTLNFYRKEMDSSTIFLYPFNLNFNRQKQFIKYCKGQHNRNYSLMGNPYSLFYYIFGLMTKNSDMNVVDVERKAYFEHSIELLNWGVKRLFTLDEFETASFITNGNLIKNNVFVLNKTHGVGLYCLYLNYSIIEVYTSRQHYRYKQWNPNIEVLFQKLNILYEHNKNYENEKVKLVFIHRNFKDYGLNYDEKLQKKIFVKLQMISLRLNLEYCIKLHPNSTKKAKDGYIDFNTKEITDISQIKNPLFITTASSSFYDFLKFGPFIFLSDNILDPRLAFGNDILSWYNYNNAEDVIRYNINFFNYKALHKSQIEHLNNR